MSNQQPNPKPAPRISKTAYSKINSRRLKDRLENEKEIKRRSRKPRQMIYPPDATDAALRDKIVFIHEYIPPDVLVEVVDEIYATWVKWKEGSITSKKGWLRTRELMFRCQRFIHHDSEQSVLNPWHYRVP